MKRFHSPYTSLHHLRRQEARLSEMELALRLSELRTVQERQVTAESAVLVAAESLVATGTGTSLAADLLAHQQYVSFLEGTVAELSQQVTAAQVVVEKASADVVEKRAGVEVIEKLLDRDRQVHRRETLKQQQHQIDEFGIRRIFRGTEIEGGLES